MGRTHKTSQCTGRSRCYPIVGLQYEPSAIWYWNYLTRFKISTVCRLTLTRLGWSWTCGSDMLLCTVLLLLIITTTLKLCLNSPLHQIWMEQLHKSTQCTGLSRGYPIVGLQYEPRAIWYCIYLHSHYAMQYPKTQSVRSLYWITITRFKIWTVCVLLL
jgi:hypothetical protein